MKISVMQLGAIATNCYIVMDEVNKKAAVVDPGDEAHRVLTYLEKENMTLSHILLTHGHYDHTTAVPELKKAVPDAQVYIHKADAGGAGSRLFPLLGQVDDLRFYDEGDVVHMGDITFEVLHTPGHSKGSIVLKTGDVLLTGDTLFAGSCGRTDLQGGDYEEIMVSLRRLGELQGNYTVCPGHDVSSDLDRERSRNPFLREALK